MSYLLRHVVSPCLLIGLLASSSAWAATYTDTTHQFSFNVPAGWKVRPGVLEGKQVLRVIPPKADQRERAAIEVYVLTRKQNRRETLDRWSRQLRKADGDREAASVLKLSARPARLVAEYREGRIVASGLWIVRHNLQVLLPGNGKHMLEARCAANASEFKTYRRQMESVCLSVNWLHP